MKIHVAIRGYTQGQLMFQDRVELDEEGLKTLLPQLAEEHATAMAEHRLHMIEIEFMDEAPAPNRFFRFGTDPSGMVIPIRMDLSRRRPQ